ncbi:hypothetical protein [Halomicrobium katesii]|uniref:hypothetical protein n=1 Tax=Halomicrobium katesii TaxID=437163 RepID=UPI000375C2BB|nr:hypothetical protein [Halomicrobium katesii]
MRRRNLIKTLAATGVTGSAISGGSHPLGIGAARSEKGNQTVSTQEVGFQDFTDDETNSGRETFSGNLNPNRETIITATLGYYGSDLTVDGWEHSLILTGIGGTINTEDDEGMNTIDGVGFEAKFTEDQYENFRGDDNWYVDFTQQRRAITSFESSGGELDFPPGTELGIDIAVPAAVGYFNPPAGVAAAVLLSIDDFAEELEPAAGDDTIEHGGVRYFTKNGYGHPGESSIGFTQQFEVVHDPGKAGIEFEVKAELWDRISDHLPWNMEPEVKLNGTAFTDSVVLDVGSAASAQSAGNRDVPETSDPTEMTQEQREKYGIKKVDSDDQQVVAEAHETNGDEVFWTTSLPDSSSGRRRKESGD